MCVKKHADFTKIKRIITCRFWFYRPQKNESIIFFWCSSHTNVSIDTGYQNHINADTDENAAKKHTNVSIDTGDQNHSNADTNNNAGETHTNVSIDTGDQNHSNVDR